MTAELSENTKAILLLAAPLIIGKHEANGVRILSGAEYNHCARHLREMNLQPADLLSAKGEKAIGELLRQRFDIPRLRQLLGRGFQLSQAFETWRARGIWVISRADASYPRVLKTRLREEAPPLLYGCGNAELLDTGGLAVVGSRQVDEDLLEFTRAVGRLCAQAGETVISGGAKGIDRAAMQGALSINGNAVGVLADRLAQVSVATEYREMIRQKRLVLVSPFDPAAGFNVGNAMQRNKVIYAFANTALVVNSDYEKGGTWAGAIEQLRKYHCCPLYVRASVGVPLGNRELMKAGAMPWPEPQTPADLRALLKRSADASQTPPDSQKSLLPGSSIRDEPSDRLSAPTTMTAGAATSSAAEAPLAERLFAAVRTVLLRELAMAKTEKEIAALLEVPTRLATAWLARMVKEGVLTKSKRPSRYRIVTQ